jgi:hypothetical protein
MRSMEKADGAGALQCGVRDSLKERRAESVEALLKAGASVRGVEFPRIRGS